MKSTSSGWWQTHRLDTILYALIFISCYFIFQHADLVHTAVSSFAYLNGHFADFYEYNLNIVGYNNYLPSSYILFAIWNLPAKLLGANFTGPLSAGDFYNTNWIVFWWKLLPALFFFGSAYILYRIGLALNLTTTNAKLLSALWLSSPIAFFSQILFGQYDIFLLFFVLWGILFLLQRKMAWFVLCFGIAATFKYFPILLLIPLLLLVEKRPLHLLQYALWAMIPLVLNILPYLHSAPFWSGVLEYSTVNRIFATVIDVPPLYHISLFFLAWFLICGWAYYAETKQGTHDFFQQVWYIGLAVCLAFFAFVFWHPQWVLLLTPFLVVTTFMHRRIQFFLFLDLVLMAVFVAITILAFPTNVDQNLFLLGILGPLKPALANPTVAVHMNSFLPSSNRDIYFTLFVALLSLQAIFKLPSDRWGRWDKNASGIPEKAYWTFARWRFFGGIALFILPALVAYWLTP